MANKLFSQLLKGTYSAVTAYTIGDIVDYNGSSYVCKSNTTGNLPTNTTYWSLLASKGDTGATGATGAQGIQGIQGVKGDNGDTGLTGAKGDKGDTGSQGIQGVQGPAGTNGTNGTNGTDGTDGLDITWKGAYVAETSYVINDAVSYNGSSYICKLASTGNVPTNTTYWDLMAQKGADGDGAGDVLGPASSTDSHVVIFDGITGKAIKDSGLTLAGTNTGDETETSIKTKLGISTITGSNTGDQDLSGLVPNTRTVNSKALSGDITLSTADIADSTDKRYCTDAQKTVIGNTSNTNTGDETTTRINNLYSTSNAFTCGSVELGNASDTTLARSAAGVVTIEGVRIDTVATTTETSSATPTVAIAGTRHTHTITALAEAATIAAPTSTITLTNDNTLVIRIKDNGTARALTWNAIFRAIGVTLPTTTVISKTHYVGCKYNVADTKWDVLAVGTEA